MIQNDDALLIDLYFARNEQALTQTKKKYGKRLYHTARNILYNHEDAEECVSDTLMKAWSVIPPHRPTLLGAFLAKITRNLAINKYEAKKAKKRGGGEIPLLLSELEESIPAGSTPEQELEGAILSGYISSFLAGLDKPTRVIFVLRYFQGEPIKGISHRLNISESKVKSSLFRTRKKLKTYLQKEGVVV